MSDEKRSPLDEAIDRIFAKAGQEAAVKAALKEAIGLDLMGTIAIGVMLSGRKVTRDTLVGLAIGMEAVMVQIGAVERTNIEHFKAALRDGATDEDWDGFVAAFEQTISMILVNVTNS